MDTKFELDTKTKTLVLHLGPKFMYLVFLKAFDCRANIPHQKYERMVLFCSLTHLAVLTKGEILGGQSDCAWPVLTHDNACMDNMQSFTIFAKYPTDGHNLVFRFVSLVFRRYIFLALCTLAIGSDPTRLPIEILMYVSDCPLGIKFH